MNKTEAAQIVAVIAAPFPWEIHDDMLEVWYQSVLEPVEFAAGLDVAMQLVETCERMPVPATFAAALKAHHQTRHREDTNPVSAMRELARGGRTVEEEDIARAAIAEMRAGLAKLAQDGPRGHWHGGPDPCQVCGGIRPGLRR